VRDEGIAQRRQRKFRLHELEAHAIPGIDHVRHVVPDNEIGRRARDEAGDARTAARPNSTTGGAQTALLRRRAAPRAASVQRGAPARKLRRGSCSSAPSLQSCPDPGYLRRQPSTVFEPIAGTLRLNKRAHTITAALLNGSKGAGRVTEATMTNLRFSPARCRPFGAWARCRSPPRFRPAAGRGRAQLPTASGAW